MGNCARACPSKIIRPDLGQGGVAGFLAPVLDFEKGYCLETCRRCTEVCPSGAISRLSLEQKRKARIGRNPATGEQIKIPAKTVVKFRVAKAAKDAILLGKK